MNASEPLLSIDRLRVEFATRNGMARVIDDVSFDLRAGETLGIVGESGSGKTTVGRAVLGLPGLTGGRVRFDGAAVTAAEPCSAHRRCRASRQRDRRGALAQTRPHRSPAGRGPPSRRECHGRRR